MLEGATITTAGRSCRFDEIGMRRAARRIRERGIHSCRRCDLRARSNPFCEERARAILSEEMSRCRGHPVARLGTHRFLERENAALSTPPLVDLARFTVTGFTRAIAASGITAPLYLTQNDGTVDGGRSRRALPVTSFASVPTNSMRGAAFLSGLADAMVVDVGGTSTDIGQLRAAFRAKRTRSSRWAACAPLRMPDLLSIGLGGAASSNATRSPSGRQSVGYRLSREALVFCAATP